MKLKKHDSVLHIKRYIIFKGISVNSGEVVEGDLLHGENGFGYISDLPIKFITIKNIPFIPQLTKVDIKTLEVGYLKNDNYVFEKYGDN